MVKVVIFSYDWGYMIRDKKPGYWEGYPEIDLTDQEKAWVDHAVEEERKVQEFLAKKYPKLILKMTYGD